MTVSDDMTAWFVEPERHLQGGRIVEVLQEQFSSLAGPSRTRGGKGGPITIATGIKEADLPFAFNVRPDPIDFRDKYFEPTLIEVGPFRGPPLPLAADNDPYSLKVRYQGSEGACTGHALAAVIDLQNVKRMMQGADVPARVSARMLYENARTFDEYADDHLPGSSLRGALKGFWNNGACDEDLAPYVPGDLFWSMTPEVAKDARKVGLGAYMRLKHVLNDYHVAITEAGAIFCSAQVHEGWNLHKPVDGVPKGVIPYTEHMVDHTPPKAKGIHAFAIVGYTPQGFLVLNSWGAEWGGYDPATSASIGTGQVANLARASLATIFKQGPMPGVALWSYQDWQDNVVDAWVIRLTAPTALPSNTIGGLYRGSAIPRVAGGGLFRSDAITIRDCDVRGHLIHVQNGELVQNARQFATSEAALRVTRKLVKANSGNGKKYQHLLYFAHGGLNGLQDATRRAAFMTPTLKSLGIYPLFYCWRTGLKETLADIARMGMARIMTRTQGMAEVTDKLFEDALRSIGAAAWREMKRDAYRLFAPPLKGDEIAKFLELPAAIRASLEKSGGGWNVTQMFLDKEDRKSKGNAQEGGFIDAYDHGEDDGIIDVKHHFVGHSAGAIALGHLFRRIRSLPNGNEILRERVGSVTLYAPACTYQFFHDEWLEVFRILGSERSAIYMLPPKWERAKDDEMIVYSKSLLHLVHNAFEDPIPDERMLGRFSNDFVFGPPPDRLPYLVGMYDHIEMSRSSHDPRERDVGEFL